MEDSKIIELYFQRSEDAIVQTDKKYGQYCHAIAYNILKDASDSQECVNDTYLKVWEIYRLPGRHSFRRLSASSQETFPLTDCADQTHKKEYLTQSYLKKSTK